MALKCNTNLIARARAPCSSGQAISSDEQRKQLAHLIGRLLAQQWLRKQTSSAPPGASTNPSSQ